MERTTALRPVSAFIGATLMAAAFAPPANAAKIAEGSGAAEGTLATSRVVALHQGQTPAVRLSKAEFLAGAKRLGVTMSPAQLETVASATACWSWDAWRSGNNIFGWTAWKSHHRVNWCGDWSWIRSYAYTERWGETFLPGWKDKGLTQNGQRYGVNWNQYQSWTQRKFCLVEYFSCVQESNPYTNTTVWPNGAGNYN